MEYYGAKDLERGLKGREKKISWAEDDQSYSASTLTLSLFIFSSFAVAIWPGPNRKSYV